jgi:Ring finger domain
MDECSVCLNPVRCTRASKRLPCNHIFHGTCIDNWLTTHTNCPNCRSEVERPEYRVTIHIENVRNNHVHHIEPDPDSVVAILTERTGLTRETFFDTEITFDASNISELQEIIFDLGLGSIHINAMISHTE